MEILRRKLLELPKNVQENTSIEQSSKSFIESIHFTFIDAMFNILSKCDFEVLDLCETVKYFLKLFYFIINIFVLHMIKQLISLFIYFRRF